MQRTILALSVALLFCAGAHFYLGGMPREASATVILKSNSSNQAPMPKLQAQVKMSQIDCQKLVVPAQYIAGVSTLGKSVVSADLEGDYQLSIGDLDTLVLPITVNLKRDFPFWASDLEMGDIPVATVTFKDGKVYINDHLVSDRGLAALKEACSSARN